MNFYAIATMEFLSGLDGELTPDQAYDNMNDFVNGDVDELHEDILFWQPFENYPVEDVIELIDNLASTFEQVHQAGFDKAFKKYKTF